MKPDLYTILALLLVTLLIPWLAAMTHDSVMERVKSGVVEYQGTKYTCKLVEN